MRFVVCDSQHSKDRKLEKKIFCISFNPQIFIIWEQMPKALWVQVVYIFIFATLPSSLRCPYMSEYRKNAKKLENNYKYSALADHCYCTQLVIMQAKFVSLSSV